MWILDKPSVRLAAAQLDIALTYADGASVYTLSAAERAAIAAAYQLYDQQYGRHHDDLRTSGLTKPCRNALYAAYSEVQKGGRLKKLRQSLLDRAETCPFCGFAEPTQLDHYLPRSDYRPLSIYPRNLVPSCGPCNNVKRRHVGAGANDLVHAYFDDLPDVDFLRAHVAMDGTALVAEFSIDPAGLDPDLGASLQFQLERMRLNVRYRKQINLFLFGQRTGMLDVYRTGGAAGLRAYLRRSATDLDDDFGRNDWRAAFMRGLAECDAFCDGGVARYFAKRRRRRRNAA